MTASSRASSILLNEVRYRGAPPARRIYRSRVLFLSCTFSINASTSPSQRFRSKKSSTLPPKPSRGLNGLKLDERTGSPKNKPTQALGIPSWCALRGSHIIHPEIIGDSSRTKSNAYSLLQVRRRDLKASFHQPGREMDQPFSFVAWGTMTITITSRQVGSLHVGATVALNSAPGCRRGLGSARRVPEAPPPRGAESSPRRLGRRWATSDILAPAWRRRTAQPMFGFASKTAGAVLYHHDVRTRSGL